MIVGLYLHKIFTFTHTSGIWGENIWALALKKGIERNYPEHKVYLFGENFGFEPEVDIAIYFHAGQYANPKRLGRIKNIYLQQNYAEELDRQAKKVQPFINMRTDKNTKVATISVELSKKHGWKLLEPAVDTDIFYPTKFDSKYNFEVAYVGNNIKDEQKTISYLRIPDLRYGVFGNGFNCPISHEDSLKVYSSSFINLNFCTRPELNVLTARSYQIAACKGFIVSEWTQGLEERFGTSIEYVRPGQDAGQRIKEVLAGIKSNPAKAKEQRERAYKIVKERFNVDVQAKDLYNWIMDDNVETKKECGECKMECTQKTNVCNCTNPECVRHGKCCDCVAYHHAKGELPVCLRKQ